MTEDPTHGWWSVGVVIIFVLLGLLVAKVLT